MREIQASEAKAHLPRLQALASILELRKRTSKVTLEEIRSARAEGRKH
jgi:hypothetical protein